MARRTSAAASKRGPWRGRTLLWVAGLAFAVAAVLVVWRRTVGISEDQEIARLDAERRETVIRITQLERDIRNATSADRIRSLAERRLGMRIPGDSQIVTLSRGETPIAATLETP